MAAAATAVVAAGCATGRPRVSPYGRTAWVTAHAALPVKGELIAVNADSVWLRTDATVRGWAMTDVRRVQVQTHDVSGKKAAIWSVIGGLTTGSLLFAACGSVDDSGDCGAVFAAAVVTWGLFGGGAAFALERSGKLSAGPLQWEAIRPYARFPQGVPDAHTWETLRR